MLTRGKEVATPVSTLGQAHRQGDASLSESTDRLGYTVTLTDSESIPPSWGTSPSLPFPGFGTGFVLQGSHRFAKRRKWLQPIPLPFLRSHRSAKKKKRNNYSNEDYIHSSKSICHLPHEDDVANCVGFADYNRFLQSRFRGILKPRASCSEDPCRSITSISAKTYCRIYECIYERTEGQFR